ncbi:YlaF family protein [Metabacillus sp. 84]|uniref:YlaF family protein n=1 Tax=unclassified Metabacillus TaxID=2675274 RepID=UPI003CED6BCA
MKSVKWRFLVLAVLAAVMMMMIGISVGLRSILGIVASIIGLCAVMGFGFATKKRMREKGLL